MKKKHGYWTVIGDKVIFKGKNSKILCRCRCGTERFVWINQLKSGTSRSCGCFRQSKEFSKGVIERNITHGKSKTRIYWIWLAMKDRCYNKRNPHYKNYGGRGIYVVEKWHDFQNFFDDMGFRKGKLTLDRVDNDGPYGPANCRWASRKIQYANSRNRPNARNA